MQAPEHTEIVHAGADDDAGLAPVAGPLRAIVEAFIPATQGLSAQEYAALIARIDARLAQEEPIVTTQLRFLVRVLDFLPLFRYGAPLHSLPADQRHRFLAWMQDCPIAKLRVGVWGLRTMIYVGWYTDTQVAQGLGWKASAGGWQDYRARENAVQERK